MVELAAVVAWLIPRITLPVLEAMVVLMAAAEEEELTIIPLPTPNLATEAMGVLMAAVVVVGAMAVLAVLTAVTVAAESNLLLPQSKPKTGRAAFLLW